VNRSEQINELAAALAKAQAKIKVAPKASVANVASQRTGKTYQYHYSTLADVWEVCRVPLSDNGLAIVQTVIAEGNRVTIFTLLAHASGQWIEEGLTLTAAEITPQAIGSAITYGRRYALGAMVGVVSDEDDDGEAASFRRRNGNSKLEAAAGARTSASEIPWGRTRDSVVSTAGSEVPRESGQPPLDFSAGDGGEGSVPSSLPPVPPPGRFDQIGFLERAKAAQTYQEQLKLTRELYLAVGKQQLTMTEAEQLRRKVQEKRE